MDLVSLIISLFILVGLLAILIFFLFKKAKKKVPKKLIEEAQKTSLEDLHNKIKNKNLTTKELESITVELLQNYSKIEDYSIYMDIIFRVTRHKSVNKKIIIELEKTLSKHNKKFASEISRDVNEGLSSR